MDILEAAADGTIRPTRLMFKANLAWASLQYHLEFLLQKGLLNLIADDQRPRYELTSKGFTTLEVYANLLQTLGGQAVESKAW